MKNQTIIQFLKEYNAENGWGQSDADIKETLFESKHVHSEEFNERRHWIELRVVAQIKDRFIAFESARVTGDMSLFDTGWEFDMSTIREVSPQTRTITITEYI